MSDKTLAVIRTLGSVVAAIVAMVVLHQIVLKPRKKPPVSECWIVGIPSGEKFIQRNCVPETGALICDDAVIVGIAAAAPVRCPEESDRLKVY